MRKDVAERAGAGPRLVEPPDAREVRADEPVLKVRPAVVTDFSDAPLFDDSLGERDRRGAAVVVAEHVYDAAPPHGFEHRLGLGERVGERLLAEDDLPGARRGDRDWLMRVAGRADVNHVNVRARDDLLPVGRVLLPAVYARGPFDLRTVAATDDFHQRLERHVEEARDLTPRVAVRLPHEAVADHGDV